MLAMWNNTKLGIIRAAFFCQVAGLAIGISCLGHNAIASEDERRRLVSEWNEQFIEAIKVQSTTPCLAARNLAMLHIAIADALVAMEPKYESFYDYPFEATDGLTPEAAVIGAATRMGQIVFPSHKGRFDNLRNKQIARFENLDTHSFEFGVKVAEEVARKRNGDSSSLSVTYIPQDQPGQWRRTPPSLRPPELPHWPKVRGFALKSPTQFDTPGPPVLSSQDYLRAWDEVRRLGSATSEERSAYQSETAVFWSCFNYTGTPAGHWNDIARSIIETRQSSLLESARVLAVLNIVLADTGIAAWNAKYQHHFWRPIHAIRNAERDGNPSTRPDPQWDSFLEAPPHPEYVSGHSAFTGAGGETLRLMLDSDEVTFEVRSDSLPDVERTYHSLRECENEIGMSRIYGGIHFRFSNEDGLALGHKVAQTLLPKLYPPADS